MVLLAAAAVFFIGWMALECYRANKKQAMQTAEKVSEPGRVGNEEFGVDKVWLIVNNQQ